MKVSKDQLVRLIETIVKREIKSTLNEMKKTNSQPIVEQPKPQQVVQKQPTSIMEALQQTYDTKDEWPSVSGDQPFDSSRMGEILNKQYQDGPSNIASQTAATENVAAEALPDELKNALNKDYSELVSRFETRK